MCVGCRRMVAIMSGRASNDAAGHRLAVIVRNLLEEKYGRGRIPGVRKISADIAKANDGETISHGQVFNILDGRVGGVTDRTRVLLGIFFGKHPSYFSLVDENDKSGFDPIHALA